MSKTPEVQASSRRSRREFLVDSAIVAGASLAGSLVGGRAVHAAGSDALKIGLVGCGGRGAGAVVSALTANPQAKLVAMADAFGDRLENSRKALQADRGAQIAVNDDHCFTGFDGGRKLLESGVDVALLAESPHFRPAHLEACIAAGVHVFAEKPMAVDAPGVRRVLAAGEKAREKGLSFVSGFETRYGLGAREAIRRVRDGAIGDIMTIQTTYNTGPLWHRGRQPQWTEMEFQMRNWYYFTWLSGDHLVEQHVHYNDMVCWLMGEEPPLHAWGYGGRQVRTESKFGDIFDHHAVVYQYAKGAHVYSFTRQQPNCFNENSKLVVGSKGQLRSGRSWDICDMKGATQWSSGPDKGNSEVNCFEEMFAGIKSGRPINDSLSMARSTMHAILGRMATHGGQRVNWNEALASNLSLSPERYAWDAAPPVLPGPDGKYPQPIPGVTKVL
ncbi:MAG: Gfo/Idh/MocA family protein [Pirellulales bacterium]